MRIGFSKASLTCLWQELIRNYINKRELIKEIFFAEICMCIRDSPVFYKELLNIIILLIIFVMASYNILTMTAFLNCSGRVDFFAQIWLIIIISYKFVIVWIKCLNILSLIL